MRENKSLTKKELLYLIIINSIIFIGTQLLLISVFGNPYKFP